MQLTPEETLLLHTCRAYLSEADDAAIVRLVKGKLSWPFVLWRAENVRTLPAVRYHLARLGLRDALPVEIRTYLDRWCELSSARTLAIFRELGEILGAFQSQNIDYFLLKGSVLCPSYYPDPQMRPMQDVDLMVHPADALRARDVLFQLGYQHGIWDATTDGFRPGKYHISPQYFVRHHALPSLTKCVAGRISIDRNQLPQSWTKQHIRCALGTDGNVTIPVFVDLHFNLSVGMDLADVWRGVQHLTILGQVVRAQSPTALLWFIAARLYYEAFQHGTVKLNMLGDVDAVLAKRGSEVDWLEVLSVARKYQFQPALYYVLGQLRAVAGANIPEDILAQLRPSPSDMPTSSDWGDVLPRLFSRSDLCAVSLA